MRINLFGGPGIGKSTIAPYIFSQLKIQDYSVELVHEYIKEWAYINRVPESFDQIYIFAKQLHKEDVVLRKVDHIVTDSPLLLQCVYARKYESPFTKEMISLCKKFQNKHDSIDILLQRDDTTYKQEGRYETFDEALIVDKNLELFLIEMTDIGIIPSYHKILSTDHEAAMQLIKEHL